jgi:DNA mismatch repair protein MutL
VSRIRVLSDALVNRIAAGEVVERPASVVKELVENSVDAEAARIEIDLVQGGRSLIRVSDDGRGMDADDALLCLERHATSKIESAADLESIATLGFRGEALPSIAAVSSFTLTTCADPQAGGVCVTVENGRILGVEGVARARGTTIEVRELFRSLPARRKFLYAPETELKHAQDVVVAAALSRPDVTFSLSHGNRKLIEVMPSADDAARFQELFRRRAVGPVRRFEHTAGRSRARGWIAVGRGVGRPRLVLLVNGRPVRDRLLVGAVMRSLREAGSGLGGATIALLLEIPADEVDVNVHPTKAEVRFVRKSAVFTLVDRAVRLGIQAVQGRVEVRSFSAVDSDRPHADRYGSQYPEIARSGKVRELFSHPAYSPASEIDRKAEVEHLPVRPSRRPIPRPRDADTPFGRLIGQYRDSYLLLEDEYGLVVIDQHVAHERVLYDRFRQRIEEGGEAPAQRLLEPILIETGDSEAAALPRVNDLLSRVGIEADLFGADTVRLAAIPVDLDRKDAERVVREMLEKANELDGLPERVVERLSDDLAAGLSCRAAVKANDPLTVDEQKALLDDLAASEHPYRCPHGRPIFLKLSQEEMDRRLGRR